MVGIKDIAKKAGVSISTVSYALNGSPKVTEATRKRITAIADELHYVPNMAARTLKRQQTNIIGVYLTNYGGSFYGQLLEGVMDTLFAKGYEMIVCCGDKSHLFLPERMIDGAIILDSTFSDEEIMRYAKRGHQIVVLDRELPHKNIRKVLLDNKAGATLAIDYLKYKSQRPFYLLTGPVDSHDSRERQKACELELERENTPYKIIQGDFTEQAGQLAAAKIHAEYQEPVAVFSLNDEMAIGMYKYFAKTDLSIGKEIDLVGFDHTTVSEFLTPSLATIEYSKHKWGSVAASKLLDLIHGEPTEDELIYTSLIRGDSVSSNTI
ncbi:LacI family DNA-binding transcriptional regulator [Carnobacterium gallinarum]|uniref:LacI family DNA-binding transcriptional regulator n=1 Tax=Carnobacterium gallinarum TaxID=2749 RepID=UPI000555CAD0|nr:LacI family DNA-binding transcriptional regulator [Carnobacterium gallinarum]